MKLGDIVYRETYYVSDDCQPPTRTMWKDSIEYGIICEIKDDKPISPVDWIKVYWTKEKVKLFYLRKYIIYNKKRKYHEVKNTFVF